MKNYISVMDFSFDFHPWVNTLDQQKVRIDPNKWYELLGTCNATGLNVIRDQDDETILVIQSIDCKYIQAEDQP